MADSQKQTKQKANFVKSNFSLLSFYAFPFHSSLLMQKEGLSVHSPSVNIEVHSSDFHMSYACNMLHMDFYLSSAL